MRKLFLSVSLTFILTLFACSDNGAISNHDSIGNNGDTGTGEVGLLEDFFEGKYMYHINSILSYQGMNYACWLNEKELGCGEPFAISQKEPDFVGGEHYLPFTYLIGREYRSTNIRNNFEEQEKKITVTEYKLNTLVLSLHDISKLIYYQDYPLVSKEPFNMPEDAYMVRVKIETELPAIEDVLYYASDPLPPNYTSENWFHKFNDTDYLTLDYDKNQATFTTYEFNGSNVVTVEEVVDFEITTIDGYDTIIIESSKICVYLRKKNGKIESSIYTKFWNLYFFNYSALQTFKL